MSKHIFPDSVKKQLQKLIDEKQSMMNSYDQRIMDIIQASASTSSVDIAGLDVTLDADLNLILSQ